MPFLGTDFAVSLFISRTLKSRYFLKIRAQLNCTLSVNENFMNMAIFEPVLGRNNLESRVLESKYAEIDQLLSQNGKKLQRNFRKAQK